jgi:hypothetical protein
MRALIKLSDYLNEYTFCTGNTEEEAETKVSCMTEWQKCLPVPFVNIAVAIGAGVDKKYENMPFNIRRKKIISGTECQGMWIWRVSLDLCLAWFPENQLINNVIAGT